MSDTIIKVENLSKRYRIGLQEKKADTFAQQIWNNFKAPIENFKRIKSLGKFEEESESVHWALKDVSFEVKKGEVLGIIGKNGAGKSTLLKILSKITEPTSGRIEMNGRVAALLEVGTGFHPELTGRENIYMNGTILGMTKKEIDRKLEEIIDFSGVEKYVDTPVKFYSSGMRVRLGFSVAAHLEPEILIIDEVLSVGDFEFQKKCLGKMEDVSQKEGRTVLFVSHNMGAVRNLTRKSILLNEGSLRLTSNTNEVVNEYLRIQKSKSENQSFESEIFEGIVVEYKNGNNAFEIFDDLKFEFSIKSKNLLPNEFRLGVTVSSMDEINIFSGVTNVISQSEFQNGRLELVIKSPNLVEGEYKLSFSLGLGDLFESRREFLVHRHALVFSVANLNPEKPSLMNWQSSYGNIVVKSQNLILS
ncbi:ABC transporter ATP-binding protein [Belliella aquatica]|uniref:ABC transporter domain-containing protein n=1 Tax=Belliella aquatica TaxID=1323734 RepID=A0ABQ1M2I1_9BACT|nr:polysaccharide ABC transporter ATP-binding protein [Belliella aquatica]MCH7407315.1 polysaccharide ABC transporter ATP-binding protein [Belliella aquatica]GGC31684.1 hypothetical protein GCM10010993_08300 [Belliella aquatica]